MKNLFCLFFILIFSHAFSQEVINADLINRDGMLLTSPLVQIEATTAVNDMYNFKFERAANQFNWFKEKYPKHPLPYFLLGLNEWWKLMPNSNIKMYDNTFLAYMDSSITFAKDLYDANKNNAEASFFLAAAYAFKSRLHADRKHWSRATFAGKNALAYLKRSRQLNELSPEFMFGDALYNYYSVWIPKNYPLLRPILMFFKKGDQKLGLKQLEEVAENAFYTRTEAQYFLVRIYRNEENMPHKAFPIAQYLATTFPDNAYFQRLYASITLSQGMRDETERVSLDILRKISLGMPGYEGVSGRYAAYFMGYIQKTKYADVTKAADYFKMAVNFSEKTQDFDSGYYHASLHELARQANIEKDYPTAETYYLKLKKYTKNKSAYHKEAEQFLRKNK